MHVATASFSLREYMQRSHRYLHDLYACLLAAMAGDASDVRALWAELEHGLMTHMEAEERYIIPAFARLDLQAARAILRDHAAFRERLLELGVAVDLHYLRYPKAEELVDLLEAHAAREDALMYCWADAAIAPGTFEAVRDHVAAST